MMYVKYYLLYMLLPCRQGHTQIATGRGTTQTQAGRGFAGERALTSSLGGVLVFYKVSQQSNSACKLSTVLCQTQKLDY
jgi:hypothetical protein